MADRAIKVAALDASLCALGTIITKYPAPTELFEAM